MSGYFKHFPKISYPMPNGEALDCSDVMIRYRLKSTKLLSPLAYYTYTWKDGDRPDSVAFNYYGSTDYAWLVMYSAELFDVRYDLPLNPVQFTDYLKSKYQVSDPYSLYNLTEYLHHYEDGDGIILDQDSFESLVDSKKRVVSIFEYEDELNESKRKIKLLSRLYLQDVLDEFEGNFKKLKQDRASRIV
jgi:hypothetical protein